jgi:hypothetical protein
MDLKQYLNTSKSSELYSSFSQEVVDVSMVRTDTNYVTVDANSLFEDRGLCDYGIIGMSSFFGSKGIIAGGFFERIMHGQAPKDIDVFFTSASDFIDTLHKISEAQNDEKDSFLKDYECVTNLKKLLHDGGKELNYVEFKDKKSIKPSIQLIKTMWYNGPEHLIDTFDFTAAQFAISDGVAYMHPLAAVDIARKRLVLHRMTFPASTLRRMVKYTQKGYYVCPGSFQRIVDAVVEAAQKGPAIANNIVYID